MKVDSVPNGAMCEGEKEDASSQKEGAEVQEPPKKEEEAPTTKEDETVEMLDIVEAETSVVEEAVEEEKINNGEEPLVTADEPVENNEKKESEEIKEAEVSADVDAEAESSSKPELPSSPVTKNNVDAAPVRKSAELKKASPPKQKINLEPAKPKNITNSVAPNTAAILDSEDSAKRCRICLGIENLTDIWESDESTTVAANIMILCPTVKIAKKDMMPQFICNACLQSLRVAIHFKTLGETTDKELRSTVKQRRKNLRETEFVVIDCNDEGGEVEENINFFSDDEEFHPPTDYNVSESHSDSDSSFDVKKTRGRRSLRKKVRRSRRGRKRTFSPKVEKLEPVRKKRMGRPARKSKETADEGTGNESSKSSKASKPTQCVYCDQTFPSLVALREHKKSHIGEKPFKCEICDRTFKFIGSFKTHQEKHKVPDDLMCTQCNKRYPNKTELRRHMVDVHDEPVAKYICAKCKRAFTSEKRLERHKEANCPGVETPQGKEKKPKPEPDSIALGRDLFKCVAPLTTTYWSDSFSD